MRRRRPAARRAGLLVVAGLSAAGSAGAQVAPVVSYGTLKIEAGVEFDAVRQDIGSPDAPEGHSQVRRFRELIGARTEGFSVFDPRLFTGNVGATFDVYQERDNNNGVVESRRGVLTSYDFDATILAAKPYTGTLYANRSAGLYSLPFSGTTRQTFENAGARLRLREDSIVREWGLPYFSAAAGAYRQHIDQTTTTIGTPYRRDEVIDVVNLQAANGFPSADLDFRYEHSKVDNRILPRNSFASQSAAAGYSRDFGADLNRRWDSRFQYYERSGETPLKTYHAIEEVRIDHYSNLFTDYRYLFARNDQAAGTDTTHSGMFVVQHELYKNLTTKAELQDTLRQVPGGTINFYAGQLDFSYRRSLPFNGQLGAHALGRYQVNDNRLSSAEIGVLDEAHAAPTPLGGGGGFTLANNFVVPASIVLVDTQAGARQATTAGVDYEIVIEGDRIRIIPLASSVVIRGGDSLAVSYSYAVPADLKYGTANWSFGGMLDFRWISVSYDHEQSTQKPLGTNAGSQLLQDWRRDDAALELRGNWGPLDARAGAGQLRYDSTYLAYVQRRLFQRVTMTPGYDLVLGITADETHTVYSLPVRQSDTVSATATLDWYAPGGWWVTGFARTRRLRDTQVERQVTSDAGVRARIVFGKLEFSSLLSMGKTSQGASYSTDRRFELKILRRF